MTTVTTVTDGPPPMRFPRLRMALGIPAAAFPFAAVITIYAYQWGHKVISFSRLNDVGYLAVAALGVAVAALVLALITLIALRRRIAYADRLNAAAAADTSPAADLAELDAATDAAIDRAYAGPPPAEPDVARAYAELGQPATPGPYTALVLPAAAHLAAEPAAAVGGAAAPRRGGSAVDEMRDAAARASAGAQAMGERLQQLRPIGGDGPRMTVVPDAGGRHAATQAIPVVRPDVERVVAPPAPTRRTPTTAVDYPPTDVDAHQPAAPWPLPAPWQSPLAGGEQNGAAQ